MLTGADLLGPAAPSGLVLGARLNHDAGLPTAALLGGSRLVICGIHPDDALLSKVYQGLLYKSGTATVREAQLEAIARGEPPFSWSVLTVLAADDKRVLGWLDAGSEPGAESDPGAKSDPGAGTEPGAGSDPGPESDPGARCGPGTGRKPRANPPATTATPNQTSTPGTGPPRATPVAAAETGAMPVSRPARAEPRRSTQVYQRTNATAVTATAR